VDMAENDIIHIHNSF